ncbi:cupin domain-containing protein [Microbulbifer marinus]|uniref:Cupin 2 domain-containing protein n=1 Tax=Microbulbifer marinus TaxID=658218 RepID=A0A1H3VSN6_9GAMM|nr:cupin domain-containing protein [Microbulbifer marinus]SDZ77786.1 cupin 2 domain-containing protein [Microbulbifer marinus]
MESIYSNLPDDHTTEHFFDLIRTENVRIERIVSHGQNSPESGWYDQDEHEWVIVLEGAGTIQFEDGREITLDKGDYINIPAHARHRVSWTEPDKMTLWLAVFYR